MTKEFADVYAGDSPSKRIARAAFWASAPPPTAEHPAVVLASRDGGDVETLSLLGAGPAAIIAVDRCESALAACREKMAGKATFIAGDVAEVVSRLRVKPSTVFLDFCAPLHERIVETMAVIANHTTAFIGVTLLLGRENPQHSFFLCYTRELVRQMQDGMPWASRAHRRASADKVRRVILDQISSHAGGTWLGIEARGDKLWFNPNAGILQHVDTVWDNPAQHALSARVEMLATVLGISLGKRKLEPIKSLALQYVGHRAPMAVVGFEINKQSTLVDPNPKTYEPFPWLKIPKSESKRRQLVREIVLYEHLSNSDRFCAAMGIDQRTIIAWRAHETRGTYAKAAA